MPQWLQNTHSPVAVHGPSSFFTKSLYLEVGKINEALHLNMDTDLWRKFIVAGVKQRRLSCFCYAFRMHEASKTAEFGNHTLSESIKRRFEEEDKISCASTGYVYWPFMRQCVLLWRIFDGSLLRHFYYKWFLKGRLLTQKPFDFQNLASSDL